MKFEIPLDEDFQFELGAHTCYVRFVDADDPKLKDDEEHFVWGCWRGIDNTIYINNEVPDSFKLSTFLHEMFHVYEDYFDLKFQSHANLNMTSEFTAEVLLRNFTTKS